MTSQLQAESLIVGGGPSGAALVIPLVCRGRAVTLIQQSAACELPFPALSLTRRALDEALLANAAAAGATIPPVRQNDLVVFKLYFELSPAQ